MFFDLRILGSQNNGRFKMAWIAGTRGVMHLDKKQIKETNINKLCDEVMTYFTSEATTPRHRFSLRLTAVLTDGIIRIYQQQVIQFQDELFVMMTKITRPLVIEMPLALDLSSGQFRTPPTPVTRVKRGKKQRAELEAVLRKEARDEGRILDDELQVPGNLEDVLTVGMARADEITIRDEIGREQPLNQEYIETFFGDHVQPGEMEIQLQRELNWNEFDEQAPAGPKLIELDKTTPQVDNPPPPQEPAKRTKKFPWNSDSSTSTMGSPRLVVTVAQVHATKDGPETSAPIVEQEQEVPAQEEVPPQEEAPAQEQINAAVAQQQDVSTAAEALTEVAPVQTVQSDAATPMQPTDKKRKAAQRAQVVEEDKEPSLIFKKFRLIWKLSKSCYIDRFPEVVLHTYTPDLPSISEEQSTDYRLATLSWESYPTKEMAAQQSQVIQGNASSEPTNSVSFPVHQGTTTSLTRTPLSADLGVHPITEPPAVPKTSTSLGGKLPVAASTPLVLPSILPALQHTIAQTIAVNGEPSQKRRRLIMDDKSTDVVVAQKDADELHEQVREQISSILTEMEVREEIVTAIVPIGEEIGPEHVIPSHEIANTEEQAVGGSIVQGKPSLKRAPQTKEISCDANKKITDIRRRNIIECVSNWNQDKAIEISDVCVKPVNRLNVARAFQDLLVLKKAGKVKLIKEDNSLELKSIEKGPKLD